MQRVWIKCTAFCMQLCLPSDCLLFCYLWEYAWEKLPNSHPWAFTDVPRQINKSLWAKCLKVKLDFLTTDIFSNSKKQFERPILILGGVVASISDLGPGPRLNAHPLYVPIQLHSHRRTPLSRSSRDWNGHLAFANKAPPARRAFALRVHGGLASLVLIFLDTPLRSVI